VDLPPVHPLEAVQDSAEVEDQDKSRELFSSIELPLAPIETVGGGTAEEPPPHALSNINVEIKVKYLTTVLTRITR
jgi:hydroxymethylglutaryl-CoA reductase